MEGTFILNLVMTIIFAILFGVAMHWLKSKYDQRKRQKNIDDKISRTRNIKIGDKIIQFGGEEGAEVKEMDQEEVKDPKPVKKKKKKAAKK